MRCQLKRDLYTPFFLLKTKAKEIDEYLKHGVSCSQSVQCTIYEMFLNVDFGETSLCFLVIYVNKKCVFL